MSSFNNVELRLFDESSFTCRTIDSRLTLNTDSSRLVFFKRSDVVKEINITSNVSFCRLSPRVVGISIQKEKGEKSFCSYFVEFESPNDVSIFLKAYSSHDSKCLTASTNLSISCFDKRTDPWSAVQYFQFYSYLSQQQNMMQDYVRTSTYQRAILANARTDFRGKVVLDVGAGSGILSFFAIQAGAIKVYAVEASNMATHCNALVQANKLAGRIIVVSGKIEDITLPEPVDIIISEPMGYMLYNERMLETYVHARKFLAPHLKRSPCSANNSLSNGPKQRNKSHDLTDSDGLLDSYESDNSEGERSREAMLDGMSDAFEDAGEGDDSQPEAHRAIESPGVMFPTVANLYIVPFSDEALFAEQFAKANFWYQQNFHGMDLTALRNAAVAEYFNQPVVDTFDIGQCPALPCVHKVDFRTVSESQLATIDIPLHFQISTCSTIHGLAFWFDVGFLGSQRDVWLSTAPTEPLTHWYQVRCLLGTPLFVQEGQSLNGHVTMRANSRQSYDVQIELIVPGSQTKITNSLDLKNPHFRYNGYPPAPPPGSHTRSPTEVYYANLCLQQQQQQQQNSVQVQSISGGGWTVPITGPIDSAHSGSTPLAFGANPLFAAALGHPNLFNINNVAIPAEFQQQQQQQQQLTPQQQQQLQQTMQLSPQPPNAPTSALSAALSASAMSTTPHTGVAGRPSLACMADAASLGSSTFFNSSSHMSGVVEGGHSFENPEHPTNGWRPNAFAVE